MDHEESHIGVKYSCRGICLDRAIDQTEEGGGERIQESNAPSKPFFLFNEKIAEREVGEIDNDGRKTDCAVVVEGQSVTVEVCGPVCRQSHGGKCDEGENTSGLVK
jgi:hypothetical protein